MLGSHWHVNQCLHSGPLIVDVRKAMSLCQLTRLETVHEMLCSAKYSTITDYLEIGSACRCMSRDTATLSNADRIDTNVLERVHNGS